MHLRADRRPRWQRTIAGVALTLAGLVAVGCTGAAPLPRQPTTVTVTMDDHAFDVEPASPYSPGRAVFEAHNTGAVAHELAIVAVPERDDEPSTPASSGMAVPTIGVVHAVAPGERGRVAVDLAAGRYALVCLIRTEEGVTHAELGQRVDFAVRR